jgi:hypothetical protein
MEAFHHVGVPDLELANSEGAGAPNLKEFEYLITTNVILQFSPKLIFW